MIDGKILSVKSIFHQDERLYKEELKHRKNSYSTYETDLEITPIAGGAFSSEKVKLFLVNTSELQSLLIKALENSKAIELQSK
ncbi:hypothetical protein [Listeria ilorinensis]|uniref:hypothetical protein n=1 Tax=Listeria ilorinensis TaxID=2867439 RepID=UPI001EF58F00|nr:hypothetical protein [Listeria ilorinensis]